MSVAAIAWVFQQDIRPSATKFVLVALADNAGDTNEAWPAVSTICKKTAQDRKTVITALARLIQLGYIEDTGKRTGTTNQVIIYRLLNVQQQSIPFPVSLESAGIPRQQSRFSAGTVPKTGHGTVKEPPNKKKRSASKPGYQVATDPIALQLASIWGRKETTPWNPKEIRAYKDAFRAGLITKEHVERYAYFYKRCKDAQRPPYPRTTLQIALNHWTGECDKAAEFWRRHHKESRPAPVASPAAPPKDEPPPDEETLRQRELFSQQLADRKKRRKGGQNGTGEALHARTGVVAQ